MTDAQDRADRFVAGLPDATDRTRRDVIRGRVGAVTMVAGVIVALAGVLLSQASDNPLDQNTQLTLAVFGVALVGLGGVVFLRYSLGRLLRYWMLRMLDLSTRNRSDQSR